MKMMQERQEQDRRGWGRWLPALGAMVVLLLMGFTAWVLRGVEQPEATTASEISETALPAVPSAIAEESPTVVPDTPTPTGPLAPGFALPDLDGKVWSLSQFRGRPVVLFFWATW